jgi:hypothetical protein
MHGYGAAEAAILADGARPRPSMTVDDDATEVNETLTGCHRLCCVFVTISMVAFVAMPLLVVLFMNPATVEAHATSDPSHNASSALPRAKSPYHANAVRTNTIADYVFLGMWLLAKLCEVRRFSRPPLPLHGAEHRPLLTRMLDRAPPLVTADAARGLPPRVAARVGAVRSAMATRATQPQPSPDGCVGASAGARPARAPAEVRGPALARQASLGECCVCLDKPRDVVLTPCAHHAICAACATRLMADATGRKCPVCRAPIELAVLVGDDPRAPPPPPPSGAASFSEA